MTEILEIAKDFAEDLAPHVISQTGTVKTFTAEQVSALYHIAVDFWMRSCRLVWWRVWERCREKS